MDYKESYLGLLETNKKLEQELELVRKNGNGKSGIERDRIFNIFHSASYLMAISKLDTGEYVDVNESFQKTLGYSKEEIVGHNSMTYNFSRILRKAINTSSLYQGLKKLKIILLS